MFERIRKLSGFKKIMLLLMALMLTVFAFVYAKTVNRVGFLYRNAILVPQEENGSRTYSGKIEGKEAVFTVSPDKTVTFQHGGKVYGPYGVKEDPAAVPQSSELKERMRGVEIRRGEELLFRGGMLEYNGQRFLYEEDGSSHGEGVIGSGSGVVLDENGNTIHTGYFWLSYYDQSITIPETFEFDRSNVGKSYFLSQYDKMPVNDVAASRISSPAKMANVFYTEDAMNLEQVSCQTTYPGTKVTYNIYLLPDNYKSPDDGYLAESIQKTYEYGGFHKATLDKPLRIQPQQSYAVEVVQEVGGKYCISLQKGMNKKTAKAEGAAIQVDLDITA